MRESTVPDTVLLNCMTSNLHGVLSWLPIMNQGNESWKTIFATSATGKLVLKKECACDRSRVSVPWFAQELVTSFPGMSHLN